MSFATARPFIIWLPYTLFFSVNSGLVVIFGCLWRHY